jgi:cation diffusion facilitator CzcD-associated flavoprotein CzcO
VTELPAVVIGAGPAGLATSAALARRGVAHLLLERGAAAGHTWEHLYDSLTLHTGRHLSRLPGLDFPRGTPLFPARAQFLSYLRAYADRFSLPVRAGCEVRRVTRAAGGGWTLDTSQGTLAAAHLVVATGIVAAPVSPRWPGQERFRGDIIHSVAYRRPEPFAGKRVLVVGVGNSGAEIAGELARAGVDVAIAVRSGAHVVPLKLLGLPIQYWSVAIQKLPRPLQNLVTGATMKVMRLLRGPPPLPPASRPLLERPPVIGFSLVDQIRAGRVAVRGGVAEFIEDGVVFADGARAPYDRVILATGFCAALAPFEGLVQRDERGFARRDGVVGLDQPNLYFVGHNYGTVGALLHIARDGRRAAELIARSS